MVPDILTFISEATTIMADLLIVLPFVSRRIRRALFKAIIVDVVYSIVNGEDGETEKMVKTMQSLVSFYNQQKGNTTSKVSSKEVND